jgi:DUF4097 and DUF4098 domain-containing protein YvlB
MFFVVPNLVMAATLLFSDESFRLEADGPNQWRQTSTGTFVPQVLPRLAIHASGRVVLQGGNVTQISYKLIQRVRAHTQPDAHRLLGSVSSRMQNHSEAAVSEIILQYNDLQSELTVTVPHQVTAVFLQTQSGDVEAYDLDGSVQARTNGGMIHCDRIRGNMEGATGTGEIRLGRIGGSAKCTSGGGSISAESVGSWASCETAGGEITIREAGGPLLLNTRGGNIQVDHAKSNVEAHSSEGVIEIFEAGGYVIADTRGGSIQVGSARGVKCDSAQGAVRLKTASGPLQVSTAIGNILAELLPGTRFENGLLSAGSGDITVLIPSNLPLSIFARNDSGGSPRIYSDFPGVQQKNLGFSRPPGLAEGTINGGGPVLRLAVTSGLIFLKRSK